VGPLDVVRAPLRAAQSAVRAVDDLHDIAERARRDPDPVEEVRQRLDALLVVAASLTTTAETIVTGGRDLRLTGESLDAHTEELIGGGRELTEVAKDLAETLAFVRAQLPRLEDSVETVADTVEPLQGLARGVGRLSRRS
jgi:DNA repair ATPase RecN